MPRVRWSRPSVDSSARSKGYPLDFTCTMTPRFAPWSLSYTHRAPKHAQNRDTRLYSIRTFIYDQEHMRRGLCSLVYAETTLCIQKSIFLHKATLKTSSWRPKVTQKQALCSSHAILHTIEAIINRSLCRAERLVRDTRLIKKFCGLPNPRYQIRSQFLSWYP